ncbi:MAG: hypothetical protein JST22_12670 [Bacteroidetes bacterium]|nr:hypothetical protein [Bacteroidota bacterium]
MPPKRAGNGEPGVGERDPDSTVPAASGSIPAERRAEGPPSVAARAASESPGFDPSGSEPYTGEPDHIVPRYIEHPRSASSGGDAGPEDREAGATTVSRTQSGVEDRVETPLRFAFDAPPVLPRQHADAANTGEAVDAHLPPDSDAEARRDFDAGSVRTPRSFDGDETAEPGSSVRHSAEGVPGTVRAAPDRGERNSPPPAHENRPREESYVPGREPGAVAAEGAGRTSVIGTVRSALRRMFSPHVELEPMKAEGPGVSGESRAVHDTARSRARSAEPRAAAVSDGAGAIGDMHEPTRAYQPYGGADGMVVPSAALRDRETAASDSGGTNGRERVQEHDAELGLSPPVRGLASEIGAGRDMAAAQHNARAAERAAVESKGGLARVRELIRSAVRPRGGARTESRGAVHRASDEGASRGEASNDGGLNRPSVNGRSGTRGETPGARAVIETVNRLTDGSAAGELRLPTAAARDGRPIPADAGSHRGDGVHAPAAGSREERVAATMQAPAKGQGKQPAERGVGDGSERRVQESPEHRMREHRSVVRRDESRVRSTLEQVGGREAAVIGAVKQAGLQPVRQHHSRRESLLHEKGSGVPGATNAATPSVKISIGRIEVRAAERKEPPAPQPRTTTRGPELSLSEYLKQRNREHR